MLSLIIQKLKINWLPISIIVLGLLMLLASFIWREYTMGSWLRFVGFVFLLIGAQLSLVKNSNRRR